MRERTVRSAAHATIGVCGKDRMLVRRVEAALAHASCTLFACAGSIDELADSASVTTFDVILLGWHYERFSAFAALRSVRARFPHTRLVVIAAGDVAGAARTLVPDEIDGLVSEARLELTLVPTVEAVLAEQLCVPVAMRDEVARPVFSHREKQVLRLLARGMTNGQIAGELYLSESTIKSHLASSFRKLGVSSRADAARRVLDPATGIGIVTAVANG